MEKYRWLWDPSQTTFAHVTTFYTCIISRFAPEWSAYYFVVSRYL